MGFIYPHTFPLLFFMIGFTRFYILITLYFLKFFYKVMLKTHLISSLDYSMYRNSKKNAGELIWKCPYKKTFSFSLASKQIKTCFQFYFFVYFPSTVSIDSNREKSFLGIFTASRPRLSFPAVSNFNPSPVQASCFTVSNPILSFARHTHFCILTGSQSGIPKKPTKINLDE